MCRRLSSESFSDIFDTLALPFGSCAIAQRVERSIVHVIQELLIVGVWRACEHVKVSCNFSAEELEWKIVDIVAEGVLDFAADHGETN